MKQEDISSSLSASPATTAPAKAKTFYGWVVVGCAFTVLCVAYGIQFSFGVFLPEISKDTGWGRDSLSWPYALYVFLYSALGAVSGRFTDRWGPRIVITVGGCLLGVGIILTSQVQAVWQMYLSLGLIAASGMSAAYVPCNATVVRWFIEKRGFAIGLTSSGASFGTFLFPPLAAALISAFGWRGAYLALGILGLAAITACAAFMVRDPEQMNLHPDGIPPAPLPSSPSSSQPVIASDEWTLAEAKRTTPFWLLNLVFILTWLVVFMPMVHLVPFAVDLGIPQFRAAMTISVVGLAGSIGRLFIATISDRLGRVATLGLCFVLQGLGFLGFTLSSGLTTLYPAAAIFGLSYGGVTALFPAIIGDFFGRMSVGAIAGFIFAVSGAPAAFGPLIAGYMYTITGSYSLAFLLSASLNFIAFALLFFLKKPQR
ncbi:MAG: MFS transporter [Deltaproteobacteria bacterium]|nr:MFS transporter [Deltaproteobacteria bacterium]